MQFPRLHRGISRTALKGMLLIGLGGSMVTAVMASDDAPTAVMVKRKPSDTAGKEYPVRTVTALAGLTKTIPALDRWGGRTDRKAKATGYFQVKKMGDRWWLIDPDGGFFLHVGVDSVNLGRTETSVAALKTAFGTPEQWATKTTTLLRQLGFNGTGAWTDTVRLRKVTPEPLVYTIIGDGNGSSFMSSFGKSLKVTQAGVGHTAYVNDCLPVFHPQFAAFCDSLAKPFSAWKNDPHLLGYFSDNEMPMPRLENYLALPPNDPAMGSSYQAAKAWLDARKKKDATVADITEADKSAWTAFVYDRYLAVTTAAIRKYDPNHLCLGPRFYAAEKATGRGVEDGGTLSRCDCH